MERKRQRVGVLAYEPDVYRSERSGLLAKYGVQLSYEAGYKELGGRTVYIVLSKGFTSGTRESQQISVNEQGAVTVEPPVRSPAH